MKAKESANQHQQDMSQIESSLWDCVIVGTGMGGGTVGLRLAQAGHSVLFIEKGSSPSDSKALKGQFAELFAQGEEKGGGKSREETFKRAGRLSHHILDRTAGRQKKLFPFMGSGVGGSSALYGMVLERFSARDFSRWPLSDKDMAPYYETAEKLFRVRQPGEFRHPGNQLVADHLKKSGLHPYHLPLANDDIATCGQCQSMLCKENCKNDSFKICVQPAMDFFGAKLITECEVHEVLMVGDQAKGVVVQLGQHRYLIQAKRVILAAGALQTPLLLQNSRSKNFPDGIGNQSGRVGRYLMRHYVDLYAMKVDSQPQNPRSKEMGLNDFYSMEGRQLGTVQSFGRLPPLEVILEQMERDSRDANWLLGRLFRLFRPVVRLCLRPILSGRLVMASIIEDSPQYANRVWRENGEICISYQISDADRSNIDFLRQKLKQVFKPFGTLFIASAEKNEMLAHVCGTCRMGVDPTDSVVDVENRVHGTSNVYVVDSSFFPTSGGTNPALTIAANALRVAELIVKKGLNRSQEQGANAPKKGGVHAN